MPTNPIQYISLWWHQMAPWTRAFSFMIALNLWALGGLVVWDFAVTVADKAKPSFYDIDRHLIFVVILVFQFLFSWHTMVKHNYYELWAIFLSQGILTLVIFMKTFFVFQETQTLEPFDIVLVATVGGFQLIYLLFINPLRKDFDMLFLRKAGADVKFRSMYRAYLRFSVVLKLDCLMSILTILCYPSDDIRDFALVVSLVVSGACVIVFFLLGRFGSRYESRPMMYSYWTLAPCVFVLVVYGVWRQQPIIYKAFSSPSSERTERQVWSLLFLIGGVVTCMLRVVTVILSVFVYRLFDQGLKAMHGIQRRIDRDEDADFYPSSDSYYQSGGSEDDIEQVIRRTYNQAHF